MPAGALGRLLELGRQLCAVQETLKPQGEPAAVVVMAADHGVAEEGISAYPQEVTAQMILNFLHGGAAINVLARQQSAQVHVVDMGIKNAAVLGPAAAQLALAGTTAVAPGTSNLARMPAMTVAQMWQALETGRRVVVQCLAKDGVRVVALGEMGIGNTTAASALTAALTGQTAEAVTGRGTGVDDAGWRRKVSVVDRALALHFPHRRGPVPPEEALTAVGGFEIAGLAGVALEAAAQRMLVVLDGFISSVAGLVAVRIEPRLAGYFVAAHQSVEIGHRSVLEALPLKPLFDLGLRLGEGTGAALALNLIRSAAAVMREMATFESAKVSEKTASPLTENRTPQ